jgi:hypothetical protein
MFLISSPVSSGIRCLPSAVVHSFVLRYLKSLGMNHVTCIPAEQENDEVGQTVLTLKTASPIVADDEKGIRRSPPSLIHATDK